MRKLLTIAVAIGSLLAAPPALATDGDLDTSFSADGKLTFESTGSDLEVIEVAALDDGRLAVLGTLTGGTRLALLKQNGALDTSFSGDGLVSISQMSPTELATTDDGKIVVAGDSTIDGTDLTVMRFSADGTPDSSFGGGDGIAAALGGTIGGSLARDLAVSPTGKVAIVARDNPSSAVSDWRIIQLTAAGSPDSSFSGDGLVVQNASPLSAQQNQFEQVNAVAVQSDGKIVAAGSVDVSAVFEDPLSGPNKYADEHSFTVIRFSVGGALDTTFAGGTGRSYPNVVTGVSDCAGAGGSIRCSDEEETAEAVTIEPDGQIGVAGSTDSNATPDIDNDGVADENQEIDFAVAHLNSNGSVDTGFSGDGRVSTAIAPNDGGEFPRDDDVAVGVAPGPAGTVVASGTTDSDALNRDFVLVRYLANGSLDTGFDGASSANGKLKVTVKSPATAGENVRGAALLPNGNVAVGGVGDAAKNYGAIAVIKNDGTVPNTQIDTGPAEASTVTTTSPLFTFSAVGEPGITTFECKYDGAHATFVDCASPYKKALADGSQTFSVRARDAAGNVDPTPATRSFTVDADPPNTNLTGDPGSFTADTTPSFTFSATPSSGASFECAVADGHDLADIDDSEFALCTSGFSPSLSDGEYTFGVRASNSGGTDPTPAEFEFELDSDAPDGVIVSGPTGLINDRTPTFEVSTDEPFDIGEGEFDLSCDLSGALTTSFPCTDAPFEFPQSLPNGSYTLTLQVQDLLSRQDSTEATRLFQVDATRPDTLISKGPRAVIKSRRKTRRVSFEFSSTEAGSKLECRLDGAAFAPCTSPLALVVKRGRHTLEVRSTDVAGNVDASPAKRSFRLKRKQRRRRA
jgi:uncharacterized delta-60 repeat protein